jgi:cytochrome c553
MWPNLAGQQQGYLVKQLKAFRDGSRSDPMMTPMAKPLTDGDIANLAAWYNSL